MSGFALVFPTGERFLQPIVANPVRELENASQRHCEDGSLRHLEEDIPQVRRRTEDGSVRFEESGLQRYLE